MSPLTLKSISPRPAPDPSRVYTTSGVTILVVSFVDLFFSVLLPLDRV